MTNRDSDPSLHGEITTDEAFEAVITELIATAHRNGIDLKGGWVCQNGGQVPDMEVMIYELEADAE